MLKNAFAKVPSKPALFIAPLLVIVVLSLYYRDQYRQCVEIRDTRAAFTRYLQALGAPAEFRLSEFTDFDWTRVRVVARVNPDTISDACPLDWNWQRGERDTLIASGGLAAMVFGNQGRVVRYVELRADEVEFRAAEGNIAPAEAVFSVTRKAGNPDTFVLTQKK